MVSWSDPDIVVVVDEAGTPLTLTCESLKMSVSSAILLFFLWSLLFMIGSTVVWTSEKGLNHM
jgi:hypothetical protein